MELFNQIITACTTANPTLINIISIPFSFLESYLFLLLFHYIFNIISSNTKKLFFTLSSGLCLLVSLFIIPEPFNMFFNYACMIILIYYIFKLTFVKSVGCVVFSAIIFNLITLAILNPYIKLSNISSDFLLTIPIHRFLYMFLSYFILSLIILLLKYKKYSINILENMNKKTKIMIYLCMITGIIAVASEIYILFNYVDIVHYSIIFLGFISLFIYFLLSIYTLTRVTKLILTKQKLASAESYNLTLSTLHDQVRCFKHDFDNTLTTIGGYIVTNDIDGLKQYYKDLVKDAHDTNTLYILDPKVVNNDGIYHLLVTKYYEAQAKEITLNITFLLDLSKLRMKIYEFSKILGILLDNAIEASSESDEKILNLILRHDFKNDVQIIKIENSYRDKNIDLDKIYKKGITSKENHTGLGLWEIKKLLTKSPNFNLQTAKNTDLFIQQLELSSPSKSLLKV